MIATGPAIRLRESNTAALVEPAAPGLLSMRSSARRGRPPTKGILYRRGDSSVEIGRAICSIQYARHGLRNQRDDKVLVVDGNPGIAVARTDANATERAQGRKNAVKGGQGRKVLWRQ
jgi:hypothetical protein